MSGDRTDFSGYDLVPLKRMVENSRPERLHEVSHHWAAVRAELARAAQDLSTATEHITEHWQGAAADAFVQRSRVMQESLGNAAAHAQNVSSAMSRAGRALDTAKTEMAAIGIPSLRDRATDYVSDLGSRDDSGLRKDLADGVSRDTAVERNAGSLSVIEERHQQAIAVMERLAPRYQAAGELLGEPPADRRVASQAYPPPPVGPVEGPAFHDNAPSKELSSGAGPSPAPGALSGIGGHVADPTDSVHPAGTAGTEGGTIGPGLPRPRNTLPAKSTRLDSTGGETAVSPSAPARERNVAAGSSGTRSGNQPLGLGEVSGAAMFGSSRPGSATGVARRLGDRSSGGIRGGALDADRDPPAGEVRRGSGVASRNGTPGLPGFGNAAGVARGTTGGSRGAALSGRQGGVVGETGRVDGERSKVFTEGGSGLRRGGSPDGDPTDPGCLAAGGSRRCGRNPARSRRKNPPTEDEESWLTDIDVNPPVID